MKKRKTSDGTMRIRIEKKEQTIETMEEIIQK